MNERRAVLRSLGALVLSLGTAELARGAGIVAVRLWPAADYTRLTLESDAPMTARHLLLSGPDRLVIDLEGLELNPQLRELVGKVKPDNPFIAGVRVGQFQPQVVRLVVDLKQPIRPQQFTLAPIAPYQHRLVFDLYPLQAPDPLLALLTERGFVDERSSREERDALGDFIGRLGQPGTAPPVPPALQQRVNRQIIVALDPGHGGEDPGAVGPSGLKEKDVVLAVARLLRERLNARPGMSAMLTRDADFLVPLHERVRKARRVQADLFISIHADAFTRRSARGASVYALSTVGATSSAARWLAQKENAADLVGGVHAPTADAQVLQALVDMSTTAQIKDSLRVGNDLLGHMNQIGHLHKRSVEQAPFAVLKAPDIPSVLVETAFISNPEDEARLRDPAFHIALADALAGGVVRYFNKNPPLARTRQI